MEKEGKEEDMDKRKRIARWVGAGALVLAVAVGCGVASQNRAPEQQANPETSLQTPEPNPSSPETVSEYPWHDNIIATKFWVGEGASEANSNIDNVATVWLSNAVAAFGGIDDPNKRNSETHLPSNFTPTDNPYYFALPYSDYDENGPKSVEELKVVPWFDGKPLKNGESILKGRWVEVRYGGKVIYAQWYDAGPLGEKDASYVFGGEKPAYARAGLDLSPTAADSLGFDGIGTEDGRQTVRWRFVEFKDVPDGPWKQTITDSRTNFGS